MSNVDSSVRLGLYAKESRDPSFHIYFFVETRQHLRRAAVGLDQDVKSQG